jgi:excisionase family DNA binding protein
VKNDSPLLSTTEVARLCRVSAMTVTRWIDAGLLPAVRTPGGWRRVRRDDALRYAAAVAGEPRPVRRAPDRLVADLVGGRRDAVLRWAREWVDGGGTVSDLVRRSLAPAMREVGERWADGSLDVGAEHRATAMASELLAVARSLAPRARDARRTLLLGCPAEERHALPALMAAQRFLDAGWKVDFLGADVPLADFVAQAERTRPSAVGISATTVSEQADALVHALAESRWRGVIVIGGARAPAVGAAHPGVAVDDGSAELPARLAAAARTSGGARGS